MMAVLFWLISAFCSYRTVVDTAKAMLDADPGYLNLFLFVNTIASLLLGVSAIMLPVSILEAILK